MTPNKSAWRKIVEWANPVEWFSYIYGRFFNGHPWLGFVPVAVVVLIFTALAWWRGVDNYNKEHPTTVESVVPSAAVSVDPIPTSPIDPKIKNPTPELSPMPDAVLAIKGSHHIKLERITGTDVDHLVGVQDSSDIEAKDITITNHPKKTPP
jgi:hypothetical protein